MGILTFWLQLIMSMDGSHTKTRHADHLTAVKMLKDIIFPRFGVPRYLMTYGGSHFKHCAFRKTLAKFGIAYRIASPYHSQTSGQLS
jgi:hypothetical protein